MEPGKTKPAGLLRRASEPAAQADEGAPGFGSVYSWAALLERGAGHALDVGAVDAQVVQLARVEAAELADGLVVAAPVLEAADQVHLSLHSFVQV